MGDIARAIVLGIVQGLTEFLPISSSAHLIVVPWLFGWEPFGLAFDVATHLGTLAAVLVYFRRDLLAIARGTLRGLPAMRRRRMPEDHAGRLGVYIIIGSIPAAGAGLLIEGYIDQLFHTEPLSRWALAVLAVMLIAVGLLLGAADRYGRRRSGREFEQIGLRDALLIGAAQATALFPGVSRSGSTIIAGLFSGLSRPVAARFSFILGIPVVFGAGMRELSRLARDGIAADERTIFAVGVVTAGAVGYLAIAGLLRFLQRSSTDVFVLYRVCVGVGLLTLLAAGFRA
ncbi:MAG TPA: undecaprenyl-diphosphatase UppP [Thermomicrobiales bacterium]|nr:undecaprenyl-diphosphatase UppP [Thermomicrobiales bacterium]